MEDENKTTLQLLSELADARQQIAEIKNILLKQEEESLQKEKLFADAVLESIPGLLYLYDEQGYLVRWNKKNEEVSGYSAKELAHMHFLDWFKEEKDKAIITEKVQQALRDGYAETEANLVMKNGTERLYHFTAVRLIIDGKMYFVGSGIDITERKLAEEALGESEDRFRSMFEHHKAIMLLIDPLTGLIVDANKSAIEFYGYSREQIFALRIQDINQSSPEEVSENQMKALAQEQTYFVFPHRLADGRTRWVEVYSSPFKTHGKSLLFSVIHDITERKRIEDENKMLAAIVESSDDAIIGKTLEGIITSWNRGAERIYGYTKDEIMGKSISVLALPEKEDDVVMLLDRIKMGEHIEHYETMRLRKDSKPIHVSLSISPIHDAQGKTIGASTIGHDISERKRLGEEIRKSEARFRGYFELPIIGIAITSLEKGWIEVNDRLCDITGYPRDEIVDMTWSELTHPEDLDADVTQFNRVLAGEIDGYTLDKRFIRKDGKTVWTTLSVRCVRLPDGRPDYFVALVQDITDRKQAEEEKGKLEEQKRQLQKAESLNRMAGAVAHHFNNQLAVVMANLELALVYLPSGRDPAERLTLARQAAEKAAEMSESMQVYLGQMSDNCELLDLSDACRQCLAVLQAIMQKDSALETDLPSPGPTVNVNMNQIQQVLTKLVINAQEAYSVDGGTINLRVKTVAASEIPKVHRFPIGWQPQDLAYACMEVADTGSGIEDEFIEKIFDPFFTSKFIGRGMGLPVVLGIVSAHQGAVTVKSEQGRGSTFRIYFPVTDGQG